MDADTDKDIGPLTAGQTINLATLPTKNLNVRATISGAVGSVVFMLDGGASTRTESTAPYAFAGDTAGNYNSWTPVVGQHSIKATPFSGAGGAGTAGTALTIAFTVTDAVEPEPEPEPPLPTLRWTVVKIDDTHWKVVERDADPLMCGTDPCSMGTLALADVIAALLNRVAP